MIRNHVDERISEVEARLTAELTVLEQRRTDIRNMLNTIRYIGNGSAEEIPAVHGNTGRRRSLSADAREAISRAQKKRWAKSKGTRTKSSYRGNNAQSPQWTSKQDNRIVTAIKLHKEPVEATEMAHLLAGRLKRTTGAVRQRIRRLALRGVLKETGNGMGSHHTVEVA